MIDMAVVVPTDALCKAAEAVYSAIKQCRELDGTALEHQPRLSKDDLSFAVLGAMTMLIRDEVLQEIIVTQEEWPPCRAAAPKNREFG